VEGKRTINDDQQNIVHHFSCSTHISSFLSLYFTWA